MNLLERGGVLFVAKERRWGRLNLASAAEASSKFSPAGLAVRPHFPHQALLAHTAWCHAYPYPKQLISVKV